MLLIAGVFVVAAVVTALKGKPWFLVIGLLVGWFWVFGSLRLAKPQSWWARRFYQGLKLEQSKARFSKDSGGFEPTPALEPPRY